MIIILVLYSAARGHCGPVSGSSGLSSYLCSRTIKKPSENYIFHPTTEKSSARTPWALLHVLMGTQEERRQKTLWCLHQDKCDQVTWPLSQLFTAKGQQEGRPLSIGGRHHFCRCAGTPRHFCCCFCLSYKVWRLLYGKNNCHIKQRMKALRELNMSVL